MHNGGERHNWLRVKRLLKWHSKFIPSHYCMYVTVFHHFSREKTPKPSEATRMVEKEVA